MDDSHPTTGLERDTAYNRGQGIPPAQVPQAPTSRDEGSPAEAPQHSLMALIHSGMGAQQARHVDAPAAPFKIVMVPPIYLDNRIPNNVFMGKDETIDRPRAMRQWNRLRHMIEALGVKTLEIPPVPEAQDQCFCANIAVAMDPVIVLANFSAEGRPPEVPPAKRFFESMGYRCIQPPFAFEGEADCKKLNDRTYIGGFGKFSDNRAYDWMEQQTGRHIIRVREISDKLYHLDCSLMVLDEQNIMVAPSGLDKPSLRALEQVANIIPVPANLAESGATNGLKITDKRVYLSGTLQPEEPNYRKAMEWLNSTLDQFGYVVAFLDEDGIGPSGADLSCCAMHLDFEPKPMTGAPVAARTPPLPTPIAKFLPPAA